MIIDCSKNQVKSVLATFVPYAKAIALKQVFEVKEISALSDILGMLFMEIQTITVGGKQYAAPTTINDADIISMLNLYKTVQADLRGTLPDFDDFLGRMKLPFSYAKDHNVSWDLAHNIVDLAYKQLNFDLSYSNQQELVKKLVVFSMLHLQAPMYKPAVPDSVEVTDIKQRIYESMVNEVVVPSLAKILTMLAQEDGDLDAVKLFDTIMVIASDYRRDIADLQTDNNAEHMGQFSRSGYGGMTDPLDAPSFEVWKNKITDKIKTAIRDNGDDIHLGLERATCRGIPEERMYMPLYQYDTDEPVKNHEILFTLRGEELHCLLPGAKDLVVTVDNIGGELHDKLYQLLSESRFCNMTDDEQNKILKFISDQNITLPISRDQLRFGGLHYPGYDQKSASYGFAYLAGQVGEDIDPLYITCIHKIFNDADLAILGDELKAMLRLNHEEFLHDGQKLLAEFLWDMSHESLLHRGQAAVTMFIMKAIALSKRYELEWSEEWTPPLGMNYDLQALSELDKDKFIDEQSHNILLHEIDLIGDV